MKRIILASKSARRIEMLNNAGYSPEIVPANIDETISTNLTPEAAVMYLAFRKGIDAAQKASIDAKEKTAVILSADTVVVHEGRIIGKPSDENDAINTLLSLRNDTHQVITGVCIININDTLNNAEKICLYDVTEVRFGWYSDKELREYVQTDEPYDLAGGYAIQKTFGKYIDTINGDYDNVVGLPWYRVEPILKEALYD